MKKTLLLVASVLSATLLLSANCQNALGSFYQIRVRTAQSDPNSCRIYLDSDVDYIDNLTRQSTNIPQTYVPTSPTTSMPAGCSFLNLNFVSWFYGDSSNMTVYYNDPIHYNYDGSGNLISSWVNTSITASKLAVMNGTECLLLRENQNGYDQYVCQINYGGIPLYWVAYAKLFSTFNFAPFAGGRSIWVMASNYIVQAESYGATVDLNTSFPDVVADIYSSCGSNNKHFYSLQVPITVTTSVDLAALLPGNFGYNIAQGYVVVKQNSATVGQYISVETPMSAIRSGSNCWTLGVTWDKVLPDMSYCANGCRVTFVFANTPNNIYVLKTTGIQTTSNLRR